MPSPMPGMDPYLEDEKLWPLFHTHLVHSLYQLLLPGLMDRYRARLAERKYVVEQALFTSIIREEHREPFLDSAAPTAGSSRPSTWSAPPTRARAPAAKRTWTSGRSFASTTPVSWRSTLCFRVNACIDYSPREDLPDWDYAVTVTRSVQPERYEIYTATVDKRCSSRLPLASDDRDTVLDLQAAVAQLRPGRFHQADRLSP